MPTDPRTVETEQIGIVDQAEGAHGGGESDRVLAPAPLPDERKRLLDALAGVAHPQPRLVADPLERGADEAVGGRELDGIRQQIDENLFQGPLIGMHLRQAVVEIERDPVPGLVELRREHAQEQMPTRRSGSSLANVSDDGLADVAT